MKPIVDARQTFTSSTESAAFGISDKDIPKIIGMLRDGIYTDKVLAVLREYSANGWDAHKMVGKGHVPLSVHIPTHEDPTLRIRDFGPGLSPDDVKNVFIKYGASTKEGTNDAVGMLGIGSKSGFAYSDSFTVISRHDGVSRTYVAVIDESDMGRLDLLGEVVCDSEDTGVEIIIQAKPEDISTFQSKARNLYRYFMPRPSINIDLPEEPADQTILKQGAIYGKSNWSTNWIAIMGCVPYRINLEQLDLTKVAKCLPKLNGAVFFDIGEVTISTSREELKYTNKTKEKLVQKFNDLVDEYVIHALDGLDKLSLWEQRLKVQVLDELGLPLSEEFSELAYATAKVDYEPGTFTLYHNGNVCTRIQVTMNTRLLIDDTGKKMDGYYLKDTDYVVKAAQGQDLAALQIILDQALVKSNLKGIPVVMLSTIPWNAPYQKPKKQVNPKHKAKMFLLNREKGFSSTYSENWDLVDRIPEDTDVHVLIEGFEGSTYDFFAEYKSVRAIAHFLGHTMPPVYGYKTSEKKPAKGMKGLEFREWRDRFIEGLMTPELLARIQEYFWTQPNEDYYDWASEDEIAVMEADLGSTHPIVTMFRRRNDSTETDGILGDLAKRAKITREGSDAGKAWAHINATYPLLKGSWSQLWETRSYYRSNDDRPHWVDYVKMVDERMVRQLSLADNAGVLMAVA